MTGAATSAVPGRDRLARLARLHRAAGAGGSILVPWRASFPNTNQALVLILVVVAVAANGYRLCGFLAALSAAVWFDFFLTRPYEQVSILRRADLETTVLLLIIGVAVERTAGLGPPPSTPRPAGGPGTWTGIMAAAQAVAT